MDRIRIGTSGYSYFWNEGNPTPFKWYLLQGFNTVEINASFYRFPSKNWIMTWMKSPPDFTFSIKVHRSITHYSKLRGKAFELWERFKQPLKEIEQKISFWLFQMPSTFKPTDKNFTTLKEFFSELNLRNSAIIEFRDSTWWKFKEVIREIGIGFCSVDAPHLTKNIMSINDVVYLRIHGREEWYSYIYSEDELKRIIDKILGLKASKKYIYLNNDHGMLPNGKFLIRAIKLITSNNS